LMERFAKELVALQPDLILTSSTAATAAMLKQTRTIPIVFVTLITVCLTAAAWLSAKTGFRPATPRSALRHASAPPVRAD